MKKNKMKKISIIGHFAKGKHLSDGQTIKTRIVLDQLSQNYPEQVRAIDTFSWKRSMFRTLLRVIHSVFGSDSIILMLGVNGINRVLPVVNFLNFFKKKRIFYVVIGGWLPQHLERNNWLLKHIKRLNYVFVETKLMIANLAKLGITNTKLLPNFKVLTQISEKEITYNNSIPLKLCTFSRVMKEKGIEDAINAVISINDKYKSVCFTLDIFGQIDELYKNRFNSILDSLPSYIQYKGIVNQSMSVEVLKHYFSLVFPTYYEGEGFAGTLIDCFFSGLPPIATNWKYNSEIITNGVNGFLYNKQQGELENLLEKIMFNPNLINDLRINCLRTAQTLMPENIIKILIECIDE